MGEFSKGKGVLILLFFVLLPTLDQYTDLGIVTRLMSGPAQDTQIDSGEAVVTRINQLRPNFFYIHGKTPLVLLVVYVFLPV